VYASDWCPDDPEDIKCCYVNTCDPGHGEGYSYCEWTDHRCPTAGTTGYFLSGELNVRWVERGGSTNVR
jgi:hypothetical protein